MSLDGSSSSSRADPSPVEIDVSTSSIHDEPPEVAEVVFHPNYVDLSLEWPTTRRPTFRCQFDIQRELLNSPCYFASFREVAFQSSEVGMLVKKVCLLYREGGKWTLYTPDSEALLKRTASCKNDLTVNEYVSTQVPGVRCRVVPMPSTSDLSYSHYRIDPDFTEYAEQAYVLQYLEKYPNGLDEDGVPLSRLDATAYELLRHQQ